MHLKPIPFALAVLALVPAAASAQDAVLPSVSVVAQRAPAAQSNRLGATLAETPQAGTIVDAALIREQEARNLDQVLSNVPGVVSGAASQTYQNFFMRGFMVDNVNNYLRDGMRFDRQQEVSLQNIEQVEVLRGPGSLQYGKLAPGGLVNLVTKKPQATSRVEVSALADRWGQLEAAVDATGAIDSGKKVLFRFNAEAKRIESFRDHVDGDSRLFAPALAFILSPATTLDLNYEYTRIDVVPDSGLPAVDGKTIGSATRLDPRAFYGETDANWYSRSKLLAAHLRHDLDGDWQLRADFLVGQLERAVYQVDSWGLAIDPQRGKEIVTRTSLPYFLDQTSTTVRLEAAGKLQTGPVQHKLLAGVDRLSRIIRNWDGERADIAPVDLYQPALRGKTFFDTRVLSPDSGDTRAHGIYLQDQMQFGAWSILAGLRHDRLEDARGDYSQRKSHTSPSAAAMYAFSPALSIYGSYSESFEANVGRSFSGQVFEPAQGEQFELGAKGELAAGLSWAAALFDLRKTNITTRDIDHPGFSVQTGEQRAKGIELELSGRVSPQLKLAAAASFLRAKISSDNLFKVGNRLRNSPTRSARVWGDYSFGPGLAASLGMTYVGERYADLRNNYHVPSSLVWDAGLRYNVSRNGSLQASLRNVGNRRYVEDAQDLDLVTPGAPRTFSLRYRNTF
ncbi:TonB-dependent siderophore receptor [Pseudoduganella sp.]|uniref:TonB-dependent siderophore receptor n=1 Tax=Pseudoduganella sp. TaxID=1880898 RepID=UPI0035B26142